MITEGFMEMNEYPKAIILLAQRKTEDIQSYIRQLADVKSVESKVEETDIPEAIQPQVIIDEVEVIEKPAEEIIEAETVPEVEEVVAVEIIEEVKEEIVEVVETIKEEHKVVSSTIENENNGVSEFTRTESVTFTTEVKTKTDEPKITTLGEKNLSHTPSRNELLSKTDNSISATMANKKITDIKQAISIGDRFRFQRELFKANGEEMNKTLSYINQLATIEEVMSFLESKYSWGTENETAEDFYQIVRRKFA
jgi:hypothetical protein